MLVETLITIIGWIWAMSIIIMFLFFYFIPTIVALIINEKNTQVINKTFLLNTFTGWTIIGWVLSLFYPIWKQDLLKK